MNISARNQLKGTVEDVELGAVMASIKIKIDEPGIITALITKESAEALKLEKGDTVSAIVKSTEIMVGK